jgi:hypothetical protein
MFSRWIVTNITSTPGTLHCRKTRIPCGDQLLICGQYIDALCASNCVSDRKLNRVLDQHDMILRYRMDVNKCFCFMIGGEFHD